MGRSRATGTETANASRGPRSELASADVDTAAPGSPVPKRLRTCLSLLRENDADTLWVHLGSCHINDDHVGLICSALENNTHVLSLDLSSNDISHVGFEALSMCLMNGGGQDMIELDLRGNKGVHVGGEALDELRRERRLLNVLVGKVGQDEIMEIKVGVEERCAEVRSGADGNGGASVVEMTSTMATTTASTQLGTDGESDDRQYSNIVQNIFQMAGDEDEDSDEDDGDLDGVYLNLEEENSRLWREITEFVDTPSPPFSLLTNALWKLNEYLTSELQGCRLPLLPDTTKSDLQTFLAATIAHAASLSTILDPSNTAFQPTPIPNAITFPAASSPCGSHRVLAATLAATALKANCPCITTAFAGTRILENSIRHSLAHPACSAIQVQALAMAEIAISDCSIACGLWSDITSPDIVDTVSKVVLDACEEDNEASMPLKRGGRRTGEELVVGFCIGLCGILYDRIFGDEFLERKDGGQGERGNIDENDDDDDDEDDDDDDKRTIDTSATGPTATTVSETDDLTASTAATIDKLKAALQMNEHWNHLIESNVLVTTRAIQSRCLGGERPEKTDFGFDGMGDLAPGQLMALLQSQLGGMNFGQY